LPTQPPPSSAAGPYSGRARIRKTSRRVRVVERVARTLITFGGLATIVAVGTICVFLVWVVAPLVREARFVEAPPAARAAAPPPAYFAVDEYRELGCTLAQDGTLEVFEAETGRLLARRKAWDDAPSFAGMGSREGRVIHASADGALRFGEIAFRRDPVEEGAAPPEIADLRPGATRAHDGALYSRTSDGRLLRGDVALTWDPPVRIASPSPVVLADEATSSGKRVFAALRADGTLTVNEVRERKNLLTGEVRRTVEEAVVPYRAPADGPGPRWLRLAGLGDNLYLVWADGRALRFAVADLSAPRAAESVDLTPDLQPAPVVDVRFLLGGATLLVADAGGGVSAWFRTPSEGAETPDAALLRRAHVYPAGSAAVTSLASSQRNRTFAVGYADGAVRVVHATTGHVIARAVGDDEPAVAVRITPKNDGVVALTPTSVRRFDLDAEYAEGAPAALVRKVWYEGYDAPAHVWQSSSGSDDFEPKFGLWPLVFGTLKGTAVALVFAVPMALLAALYVSEFLHPRRKAAVKPAIEMMASLPSVVLGFIAALVLAPVVERAVPAILAAFFVGPAALLAGAYGWQMLPERWTRKASTTVKFLAVAATLAAGFAAAPFVGRGLEVALFAGDLRRWLDGQIGGAFGGWAFLALPPSAIAVGVLSARFGTPALQARLFGATRARAARFDAARFGVCAAASLALAAAIAGLLTAAGFDARGLLLGTYVQRNALIVGFAMGFAVIPLIFTLAEDALSSVPDSLRSASLGAGATPWQTAIRVVAPTATSGLFSACMVGLGRAVGETMIVLMAAGNTPVLDWNLFNGFRTLSANIAVELPEAVQGGVHYRILFLTALTLFAITFALNTCAEVVRQRFRKRAFQL